MRCVQWFAGSVALMLASAAFASEEARRFEVELVRGVIWADGEDLLLGPTDDRVQEISSGNRWELRGRWKINDRWFLSASLEDARLKYENVLDPFCPVTATYFVGLIFCQGTVVPRPAGQLEDRYSHTQARLGYRLPVAGGLSAVAELGVGRASWQSRSDVEAAALVRCLEYQSGFVITVRVPNCREVDAEATESGLVSKLGLELEVGRATFGVGWDYQGFRHEVYRNEAILRFVEENCRRNPDCQADGLRLSNLSDEDSWDWYSARFAYQVTPSVGIVLDVETGGSRGWNVANMGLRFSF